MIDIKDNDLIYKGMYVTLSDWETRLYGCVLDDYKEYGRLMVGAIYEDNTVQLTCGGLCVNFHKAMLERNDEDIDILRILKNKKTERDSLLKEISNIEKYINETCNKELKK